MSLTHFGYYSLVSAVVAGIAAFLRFGLIPLGDWLVDDVGGGYFRRKAERMRANGAPYLAWFKVYDREQLGQFLAVMVLLVGVVGVLVLAALGLGAQGYTWELFNPLTDSALIEPECWL